MIEDEVVSRAQGAAGSGAAGSGFAVPFATAQKELCERCGVRPKPHIIRIDGRVVSRPAICDPCEREKAASARQDN